MNSLGDSFPPKLRDQLINDSIIPGKILRLYCDFTNPPKNKFLVIVNVNPLVMTFIINSGINAFIRKNSVLNDLQIKITPDIYPFLTHDSFIACNELNTRFTIEGIKTQLGKDLTLIKGDLTPETKSEIIKQTSKSILYSKEQKNLIAENFAG